MTLLQKKTGKVELKIGSDWLVAGHSGVGGWLCWGWGLAILGLGAGQVKVNENRNLFFKPFFGELCCAFFVVYDCGWRCLVCGL